MERKKKPASLRNRTSRNHTPRPSRSEWFLLFNDRCPLCQILADRVSDYSKRQLRLLPLNTEKALHLLRAANRTDPPETYFIVEKGDEIRIWQGLGAVIELPRLIGIRNSLKLLGLYAGLRGSASTAKTGRPPEAASPVSPERRLFLHNAARGALIIGLGGAASLLLGTRSAEACNWPAYTQCVSNCTNVYDACMVACGGDPGCSLICRQNRDNYYLDCCYQHCYPGPCPQGPSPSGIGQGSSIRQDSRFGQRSQ